MAVLSYLIDSLTLPGLQFLFFIFFKTNKPKTVDESKLPFL